MRSTGVVAPPADASPVEEATQAVHVGLWASATRCVLTYVVAPVIGAVGVVLGPLGVLLQVLGAFTSTAGAHRLWRTGHRLRTPYVGLAVVIDAVTLLVLAQSVGLTR